MDKEALAKAAGAALASGALGRNLSCSVDVVLLLCFVDVMLLNYVVVEALAIVANVVGAIITSGPLCSCTYICVCPSSISDHLTQR